MTVAQQQLKQKLGANNVYTFLNLNKEDFKEILSHFILGQDCAFFSVGSVDYGVELKAESTKMYIIENFNFHPVAGTTVWRILNALLQAHKKGEKVAV